MKIILKNQAITLACLIFFMGMVSCNSEPCKDPCAPVPCDSKSKLKPEPAEGNGTPTTPTVPGSFEFYLNDEIDTPFENGVDIKLEFDYNTAPSPVGFIQIVRTINLCDTSYIYPTGERKQRVTLKGWYVDRAEGYESPVFGQNDNGSPERWVSWGTNMDPAYMEDIPYRPENRPNLGIRWQAVSVPVYHVKTGDDWEYEQLGYYYWSWTVTEFGQLKNIKHGIANDSLIDDVNAALAKWVQWKRNQGRLSGKCIELQ